MGEVLIGGTAALLICIFLSPRFIEFLRVKSFGQHIREEGPEGHRSKAGTPTMGGIIIFTAISIPFLILSDYDWRSVGVYAAAMACALLGFADDYTKIIRRRSLGLRARTKLGVTIAISIALWWIATREANAVDAYKQAIIESAAKDVVYTPYFTGVHGNYLRQSIVSAGMDPDNLPEGDYKTMNFGSGENQAKKAWS